MFFALPLCRYTSKIKLSIISVFAETALFLGRPSHVQHLTMCPRQKAAGIQKFMSWSKPTRRLKLLSSVSVGWYKQSNLYWANQIVILIKIKGWSRRSTKIGWPLIFKRRGFMEKALCMNWLQYRDPCLKLTTYSWSSKQ